MLPTVKRPQYIARPAIVALTVRSAIGAHRILVRPAMWRSQLGGHHGSHRILVWPASVALTVRPAIAAPIMFINNKTSLKKRTFLSSTI